MDTSYYTQNNDSIPVPIGSLANISLIVVDVDGTLTDSGIYYDEHGNELKKFSTRDAAGFFEAKVCGIETMILTGRECMATTRRMKELQVDYIEQQITNKAQFLKTYMGEHGLNSNNIAYIGDDINDYECMVISGFVGCPNDAVITIKEIADYISPNKGGQGAVRDIIEHILSKRGQQKAAVKSCYKIKN